MSEVKRVRDCVAFSRLATYPRARRPNSSRMEAATSVRAKPLFFSSLISFSAFDFEPAASLAPSLERLMKSSTLRALASGKESWRTAWKSFSAGRLLGFTHRRPSLKRNWQSSLYTWNPLSLLVFKFREKLAVSKIGDKNLKDLLSESKINHEESN